MVRASNAKHSLRDTPLPFILTAVVLLAAWGQTWGEWQKQRRQERKSELSETDVD